MLAGTDLLERHPALEERWEELEELLAEPISPEELAEQLDSDPESVWLALEALNAIEPDLRVSIVEDLRGQPANPGLVAFLHALILSDDPGLRASALGALEALEGDDESMLTVWDDLSARHPDEEIRAIASSRVSGRDELAPRPQVPERRPAPEIVRALVTAVDPDGRGEVVVVSRMGTSWTAAAFSIQVEEGLREVFGHQAESPGAADLFVQDVLDRLDRDAVECPPDLALGLARGVPGTLGRAGADSVDASLLAGEDRWAGLSAAGSCPIPALESDPSAVAPEMIREAGETILSACPGWVDRSALAEDLGRNVAERAGAIGEIDPGAVRFLVERELMRRIETIRRMLLWMAAYWTASGEEEPSRAGVLIAGHLGDDQHVVPGHPFLVALARRSLWAAAERVRAGESARPSAQALQTRLDEGP